jgi:hypothetical protein
MLQLAWKVSQAGALRWAAALRLQWRPHANFTRSLDTSGSKICRRSALEHGHTAQTNSFVAVFAFIIHAIAETLI